MHRTLIMLVACLNLSASNWYIATNGTGNGSLSSPWFLQTALTNSSVNAGDTLWLRSGTYFPTATWVEITNNILGWQPTIHGTSNSLITLRSFPGESAAIDRRWDLKNAGASYLRFRDIEFFDSLKGHNLTNSSYPNGPWVHFGGPTLATAGFEWINCLFHDMDNCFGSGAAGNSVRGCIFWHVGWNDQEHVFYGPPYSSYGNICGWEYNDFIEHSFSNMFCQGNIVFGNGNSWSPLGGSRDAMIDGGGTVVSNYFYNAFASTPSHWPESFYSLDAGTGVSLSISNNVVVGPSPIVYEQIVSNNFNNLFLSNVVYMNSSVAASPVVNFDGSAGTSLFDYNNYYSSAAVTFHVPGSYGQTFAQWKAFFSGYDTHSTANASTAPGNMVFVIPNADVALRAHIAVYNFSHADNVTVDVSSVLATGNTYQLISAQNYNAGVIKSGTLSGTTITVPMTNLSTAPILYGTNVNYQGVSLVQPPPTSPEFGAFVLIGDNPSTDPFIRVIP